MTVLFKLLDEKFKKSWEHMWPEQEIFLQWIYMKMIEISCFDSVREIYVRFAFLRSGETTMKKVWSKLVAYIIVFFQSLYLPYSEVQNTKLFDNYINIVLL